MNLSIRTIKRIATGSMTVTALAVALLVPQTSPKAGTVVDDSANVFKAQCASCHGLDGSGNTAAGKKLGVRDLRSAEVKKMSDEKLNTIITKGKEKMPAAKGLNAAQIKEMVAYIRSLQK